MPRNPLRTDPTRTKLLRSSFEKEMRKRFRALKKETDDLFLRQDVLGEIIVNVGEWRFLSDERKLEEFRQWLERTTGLTILNEEDRFWEDFVQKGYERGAGRAFSDVNKRESTVAPPRFIQGRKSQFLSGMLGAPETVEKVQLLASRVFTDIKGVTEVLATQLRRVLADGLVEGLNPRAIARRMADDVFGRKKAIGRSAKKRIFGRAETIARTEIIRAHAEGQLDAMERMGVEEVGVAVEWRTAGDDRVCPLCNDLNGVVLKIEDAHNLIPRHPNCRCAFIPANVGEDKSKQIRRQSRVSAKIRKSVRREKNSRWPGGKRKVRAGTVR